MTLGNGNLICSCMSAGRPNFWEAGATGKAPYSFIRARSQFYFFLSGRPNFWEARVLCQFANPLYVYIISLNNMPGDQPI